MAQIDMTHRLPRYSGRRAYLAIRPSTEGTVNVGDTVDVSGGWSWTVDAIGEPFTARGKTEVRVWLRDERPTSEQH